MLSLITSSPWSPVATILRTHIGVSPSLNCVLYITTNIVHLACWREYRYNFCLITKFIVHFSARATHRYLRSSEACSQRAVHGLHHCINTTNSHTMCTRWLCVHIQYSGLIEYTHGLQSQDVAQYRYSLILSAGHYIQWITLIDLCTFLCEYWCDMCA